MKEFVKGLAIAILLGMVIVFSQGYYLGIVMPLSNTVMKFQFDNYLLLSFAQWLRLILIIVILIFLCKKT